jgi:hypothetical protein
MENPNLDARMMKSVQGIHRCKERVRADEPSHHGGLVSAIFNSPYPLATKLVDP